MLLSRARPSDNTNRLGTGTASAAESIDSKLPKLDDFLGKRDFVGALTLLEFQRSINLQFKSHGLIAYCNFHLGDYKKALEEYSAMLKMSGKSDIEEKEVLHLNMACCLFCLGRHEEANKEAQLATANSALKSRLMFHLAHRLGDEDAVLAIHEKLEDTLENQLSLASLHYIRLDFQNSIDIYKRVLLDNRAQYLHDEFDETCVHDYITTLSTNTAFNMFRDQELRLIANAILQSKSSEFVALNVYVALCYHRLEYFDVSQEVLAVYLQAFPGSAIALNLKACNTFRLYSGTSAEKELKPLLNVMQQDEHSKHGMFSNAYDLIKHNLVVFRNGEGALQVLPKLVDVIPEARLNLIIYYLQQDDVSAASNLMKDLKAKTTPEFILLAVVNTLLCYQSGNREHLQTAQSCFHRVGSSENEHDSIFGRLCMASSYFLTGNYDHCVLYLNSVRTHYYNDDSFNFNFAQAKAMQNQFGEAEELLQMVQNEKIRNEFTFMQLLARTYIMNGKPRLAWELHSKMDTSPESFELLHLIGSECFRMGQFYYAAKAYDILEKFESTPEIWDGKRAACIGVFQLIIAGQEPKESLQDIIALLRNSPKQNAEKILTIMKKWAKENRINL